MKDTTRPARLAWRRTDRGEGWIVVPSTTPAARERLAAPQTLERAARAMEPLLRTEGGTTTSDRLAIGEMAAAGLEEKLRARAAAYAAGDIGREQLDAAMSEDQIDRAWLADNGYRLRGGGDTSGLVPCQAGFAHPSARVAAGARIERGVIIEAGASIAGAVLHAGCVVRRGASIGNRAVIGRNAEIGHGCHVDDRACVGADCELGDDTHVHQGATLSTGVHTGTGCRVGHDTLIQNGARLGDGVHVADRCDVGAGAKLGDRTRVAYDSTLGPQVTTAADALVGSLSTLGEGTTAGCGERVRAEPTDGIDPLFDGLADPFAIGDDAARSAAVTEEAYVAAEGYHPDEWDGMDEAARQRYRLEWLARRERNRREERDREANRVTLGQHTRTGCNVRIGHGTTTGQQCCLEDGAEVRSRSSATR